MKWNKAVKKLIDDAKLYISAYGTKDEDTEKLNATIINTLLPKFIEEYLTPLYQQAIERTGKAEARIAELLGELQSIRDALDYQTEQVTILENDNEILARRVEQSKEGDK